MKDELVNFAYFVNDKNYLKELSKKDNYKLFNEKIKKEKKYFCLKLLFFILIIFLLFYLLSLILKLEMKNYIKYPIIMISMLYYFIFHKIMDNFSNCYTSFIKLCEMIVKYDNIIKSKIKINRYLKNAQEKSKNNLINIINIINNVINTDMSKKSPKNDNDNDDITEAYSEYLKLKTNLFKFIFEEYEKAYIGKENYISKYIQYISNYNNFINLKINNLIIEFNKSISKLYNEEKEEIDYNSLIKQYEKYISDNVLRLEEIKKNDLKNKIYDLLISNYELNKNFIELIKEIDANEDEEKINQMIEVIIEKKQLSISLLEQYKIKINKENDKDIKKENEKMKNDTDSILYGNKFKNNNGISAYDIQLSQINLNKKSANDKNGIIKHNKKEEYYDIYKEQEKIQDLKSSFIDELNNYCKKVKGLNRKNENTENEFEKNENINKDNDNNNDIINKANNNTINDLIKSLNKRSEELNLSKPQTKLDFAKSLTMAFGKNKNFNLNFVGEEINENNTKEDK